MELQAHFALSDSCFGNQRARACAILPHSCDGAMACSAESLFGRLQHSRPRPTHRHAAQSRPTATAALCQTSFATEVGRFHCQESRGGGLSDAGTQHRRSLSPDRYRPGTLSPTAKSSEQRQSTQWTIAHGVCRTLGASRRILHGASALGLAYRTRLPRRKEAPLSQSSRARCASRLARSAFHPFPMDTSPPRTQWHGI